MTIRHILEKIIKDALLDLASFRVQLVYMSYLFNGVVLWAVIFKSLDYHTLAITFATQTILYGFYFVSKFHQAQQEQKQDNQ